MNPPRVSWEEYALRIAEIAALRSEDVYKRVGACALNHSNRVIAVAYNGLAPSKTVDLNFWADRDKRRKFMIHAEINALSLIKNGECKLLASTLMPCAACATAIAANGVKKVVYKEIYERSDDSLEIFDFYGIECQRIIT